MHFRLRTRAGLACSVQTCERVFATDQERVRKSANTARRSACATGVCRHRSGDLGYYFLRSRFGGEGEAREFVEHSDSFVFNLLVDADLRAVVSVRRPAFDKPEAEILRPPRL